MQPGPDERLAGRGLALGDLVLVVREDEVDAAGVDVERSARGAPCSSPSTRCASPAGPAPIGRVPRRLAGLGALPEREVADVVLAVLVGLDPLADPQLLGVEPGEPPVRRPRRDPEEDRAVVGPVGVAALEQGLDEVDDLVDVLGRPRQDVGRVIRSAAASARKRSSPAVGRASPIVSPAAAAPRMILSSMSVMFMTHVTRQAALAQVADEQVGEQERAEVADVGRAVDGRAAAVDAGRGRARAARTAGSRPSERVAEAEASSGGLDGRDGLRRDGPAGALVAGEVAGRGLDVDRPSVEARASSAIASRIASSAAAQPGPRADDRQVDRRGPPARAAEPATTSGERARAGDARAASARRPGRAARGRPGRPRRAARRRPRGARRRRRSGRAAAARRRSRCRRAPAASPARTGGCRARSRSATAGAGRRARAATRRGRAGSGHLEVASGRRGRHGRGCYRPRAGRPRRCTGRVRRRGKRAKASRSRSRRTPCGVWAAARSAAVDGARRPARRRPA